MRIFHTLPIAAAILLAACGGDNADADGEPTGDQAAAEAEALVQPRAGQYRSSFELLEFDASSQPESAKDQVREIYASGLAEGNSFCMTEAQAAGEGGRAMAKHLAEGDCTVNSFNVSGNTVVADLQCPAEGGGGAATVHMEGQMRAESSTMTIDRDQEIQDVGATSAKMRVTTERIGDCAA